MTEDTLCEISRHQIIINKYEEPHLSWHNSILTVQTDKGIYFFSFNCNLECSDKKVEYIMTFLPISNLSPATDLIPKQLLRNEMTNMEYTEMLMNPALWPHNPQIVQDLVTVTACKWSPVGFISNNESVIAVLNTVGNVQIYTQGRCQWTSILNLSTYLNKFIDHTEPQKSFKEVKEAAYAVETCAICWAPALNGDNSCYFVTAQKNGTLFFWNLLCNGTDVKVKLQGSTNTDAEEIDSMLWIKEFDKNMLVCSNIMGQIFAFECVIEKDVVQSQLHTLWSDRDRMIAKYLHYSVKDDYIILLCNKYRHLLVLQINKKFEVESQYIKNINDHKITTICNTFNCFYVTTVNCKLYKGNIMLSEKENKLDVTLNLVENKESYPCSDLYGFTTSANNVICALGVVDRKISSRKKKVTKLEVIFATTDRIQESLSSILLNNPSKRFTNYWDCIELLRCKTYRSKTMPSIDYNQLYEATAHDVYKLKVYLILVILCKSLKTILRSTALPELPEMSVELIKDKVLLHQACELMNNLLQIYEKKSEFKSFEMECFYGAKRYIEYYSKKYKKNVNELIESDFIHKFKSVESICQCCDDKIDGFYCKSGHVNMFCSLTFTFIQNNDYLVCNMCGVMARRELYTDKPMCIFCDIYLCEGLNTD